MIEIDLRTFTTEIDSGEYAQDVTRYCELRAAGSSSMTALAVAFGPERTNSIHCMRFIDAIEASKMFRDYMDAHPWTEAASVATLRDIAANGVKNSDRIAAVRELNTLHGLTMVDEQGRTRRAGGNTTFDDFLRMKAGADAEEAAKAAAVKH